jgi:dTDP-4-dehydrorhamnose reductase
LKALLLGPNGQLGHDIRAAHAATGEHVDLACLGRDQLDVANLAEIPRVLGEIDFDILINCTSYHKTDEVEENASLAIAINSHAVEAMARICKSRGARLVHISTDYVFGGDRTLYRPLLEIDPPRPVNVYGASKALGETLAQHANEDTVILRVASLFGIAGASGKGGNFVETMIRLARERGTLRVVDDQVMSPTATADVASAILKLLIDGAPAGIYHVVNSGAASWYEFAREIIEMTSIDAEIVACRSEDFPTRAARPRHSVLDNNLTCGRLVRMPDWRDALKRYLIAKGHITGPGVDFSRSPGDASELSFQTRYDLMSTEQAPPGVIAEWLEDPMFLAYVKKRRRS